MSTYLLTWNPVESSVAEIEHAWAQFCAGRSPETIDWSCGSTKSISVGARVFLHRQRREPRGIVAAGWVVRETYQKKHWRSDRRKRGELANYVDWHVEAVVPGFGDEGVPQPLPAHLVSDGPLQDDVQWKYLVGSGVRISDAAARQLEELWAQHVEQTYNTAPQGERLTATENRQTRQLIWSRSRERALRDAKIRSAIRNSRDGRLRCEVPGCGFCFEEVYGDVGRQYAHVHHLNALGGSEVEVRTGLDDLAIVCANCHAMIHRHGACRPLDGLVDTPRRSRR
jgi:predicted HNH restriction endonuclease